VADGLISVFAADIGGTLRLWWMRGRCTGFGAWVKKRMAEYWVVEGWISCSQKWGSRKMLASRRQSIIACRWIRPRRWRWWGGTRKAVGVAVFY
jgi:hypothetical protein